MGFNDPSMDGDREDLNTEEVLVPPDQPTLSSVEAIVLSDQTCSYPMQNDLEVPNCSLMVRRAQSSNSVSSLQSVLMPAQRPPRSHHRKVSWAPELQSSSLDAETNFEDFIDGARKALVKQRARQLSYHYKMWSPNHQANERFNRYYSDDTSIDTRTTEFKSHLPSMEHPTGMLTTAMSSSTYVSPTSPSSLCTSAMPETTLPRPPTVENISPHSPSEPSHQPILPVKVDQQPPFSPSPSSHITSTHPTPPTPVGPQFRPSRFSIRPAEPTGPGKKIGRFTTQVISSNTTPSKPRPSRITVSQECVTTKPPEPSTPASIMAIPDIVISTSRSYTPPQKDNIITDNTPTMVKTTNKEVDMDMGEESQSNQDVPINLNTDSLSPMPVQWSEVVKNNTNKTSTEHEVSNRKSSISSDDASVIPDALTLASLSLMLKPETIRKSAGHTPPPCRLPRQTQEATVEGVEPEA